MRLLMKNRAGVLAAFVLTACGQPDVSVREILLAQTASLNSTPAKKTACVSFQGNGVYFSSHVGALIALLENNFEPVFATGGSSGAIIAGVARALAENPSLSRDGEFSPQDAARVLAASAPIVESVLFLPRFTTPLMLIDALDVFMTGSSLGVLRADPDDGLVNAESIVGQSALVIDYYRSADFRAALAMPSVRGRELELARQWKLFANTIDVTPDDVADAVLTSRDSLAQQGRADLVSVQDRLFKFFRTKHDSFYNGYKARQESWNNFIAGNSQALGLNSRDRRQALFRKLLSQIKSIESFDALAATMSGQFMLADPDRAFRAFEGFDSRSGRRIEIPSNTVIHSTARRAKRSDGDWIEAQGLANLHQVYFTNPAQTPAVAQRLLQPQHNPLKPVNAELRPVVPTERIVVTSTALGPTLAATTGEPTAFLRYPIDLDVPARLRLGWTNVHEGLIGYGGWLEKVSLGTARQFDQCAPHSVDAYFYTSDGEGVNRFAKMAFLGLFLNVPVRGLLARQIERPTDIRALFAGTATGGGPSAGGAQGEFDSVVNSADNIFSDNRNVKGRLGHIPVNFSYVNPSDLKGSKGADANIAIRSNRRAMILASYEFTLRILEAQQMRRAKLSLWNISGDAVKVLSQPDAAAVRDAVDAAFPRLNY